MQTLGNIRNEFSKNSLDTDDVHPSPVEQFQMWLHEAMMSAIPEPTAMTLSTCTTEGRPSSRIVLLKEAGMDGFVWFTNYQSRKGNELAVNPNAALNFFWPEMERQIRVEGKVEKVTVEESDAYFTSRPPGSRIAAAVSPQSRVISSRRELDLLFESLAARFPDGNVARPAHWGGYRLIPDYFEFWQGRPNRLHDRITYRLVNGSWIIERLGA
jgi:pyridoxamine 5'-phosphate oxidase